MKSKSIWGKYLVILVLVSILSGLLIYRFDINNEKTNSRVPTDEVKARKKKKSIPKVKPAISEADLVKNVVARQPMLTSKESEIASKIDPALLKKRFVGTALIVKNGKIIYQRGYGYANKAQLAVNHADSQFQILSIQKVITAQLIMQLVEQHKLSLSDSLSKFYPNVPHSNKIKIKNLLNMTSGLSFTKTTRVVLPPKKMIDWMSNNVKSTGVLTKWHYSEVNYSFLAGILMQITKKDYYDLFENKVLIPLKIKNSGFIWNRTNLINLSTSYRAGSNAETDYKYPIIETTPAMSQEIGTSNYVTSPIELYHLLRAVNDNKLISKQYNQELRSIASPQSGYSGGMYDRGSYYGFRGYGYGENTEVNMSYNGKDVVILMSNIAHSDASLRAIGQNIFLNLVNGNL